jgi:hypothetical protein
MVRRRRVQARTNDEEEITRCVCGDDDASGTMIQCEQCNVWQHMGCVNVKKVPAHYFCEECQPVGHPFYQLFQQSNVRRIKKRATINSRTAELFDTTSTNENQSKSQIETTDEVDSGDTPTLTNDVSDKPLADTKSVTSHTPSVCSTPPSSTCTKSSSRVLPKTKHEYLRRIAEMKSYFEHMGLEIVKDKEEWELEDNELDGSLVEIQSKIYNSLIRFESRF